MWELFCKDFNYVDATQASATRHHPAWLKLYEELPKNLLHELVICILVC